MATKINRTESDEKVPPQTKQAIVYLGGMPPSLAKRTSKNIIPEEEREGAGETA